MTTNNKSFHIILNSNDGNWKDTSLVSFPTLGEAFKRLSLIEAQKREQGYELTPIEDILHGFSVTHPRDLVSEHRYEIWEK